MHIQPALQTCSWRGMHLRGAFWACSWSECLLRALGLLWRLGHIYVLLNSSGTPRCPFWVSMDILRSNEPHCQLMVEVFSGSFYYSNSFGLHPRFQIYSCFCVVWISGFGVIFMFLGFGLNHVLGFGVNFVYHVDPIPTQFFLGCVYVNHFRVRVKHFTLHPYPNLTWNTKLTPLLSTILENS